MDGMDPKIERDDSMKDDDIAIVDLEDSNSSGRGIDNKLGSSNTSLDKYVGKGRNSKYMTLLPEDFEPGDMDVLCGRGKRCFNSPGNQRFRKLVSARAEEYAAASTRTDKTFIVCSIVSDVRKGAPKGGFVKKDSTTGRWYEVGDFNAHEKTSQMFRDVLHESYLSSNKSKKKRRDLFRTNSKKRAIIQQQTINASAGRFLRGNVARHHSYGSVKRAVAGQQNMNMFNMRTNSQAARTEGLRNNSSGHSVHSGHDSWHNSFQSGDGINSEPGLLLRNNPRFNMAGRRANSNGSLGDLNNSFGELQAQDQFQNSFGEFNNGGGGGGGDANFHNSCVEFPSSFADINNNNNNINNMNNNNVTPQQFHNSFAGFNSNNNYDLNINTNNNMHNSFGELPYSNGGQDAVMPMHARSNPNNSGHSGHYRNTNNYSPNPEQQQQLQQQLQQQQQQQHHQQQAQYMLENDSVPLSISITEGESGGDQFQLEFETDENSANRNRTRQPIAPTAPTSMQGVAMSNNNNNLSIVDALEQSGFAAPATNDENPFEPAPLPDMEPEIFQL